jgi:hypothetical protein
MMFKGLGTRLSKVKSKTLETLQDQVPTLDEKNDEEKTMLK